MKKRERTMNSRRDFVNKLSEKDIIDLAWSRSEDVGMFLAFWIATPAEALVILARSESRQVRERVAGHPKTHKDTLEYLSYEAQKSYPSIGYKLSRNPNLSIGAFERILGGEWGQTYAITALDRSDVSSEKLIAICFALGEDSYSGWARLKEQLEIDLGKTVGLVAALKVAEDVAGRKQKPEFGELANWARTRTANWDDSTAAALEAVVEGAGSSEALVVNVEEMCSIAEEICAKEAPEIGAATKEDIRKAAFTRIGFAAAPSGQGVSPETGAAIT